MLQQDDATHIGCSPAAHCVEHYNTAAMFEHTSGTTESTDAKLTLRNSDVFLQDALREVQA